MSFASWRQLQHKQREYLGYKSAIWASLYGSKKEEQEKEFKAAT